MIHKKLTLTIVIPVYNEELYLPACLEAIFEQSVMPDKVIIVDNGSTDLSRQIAKDYKRLKIVHEPKLGVIYARDKGFNKVQTDIIARIDADTLISPLWVERLHQVFANPKVAAVSGPIGLYDLPAARINFVFDHLMRKHIYRFGKRIKKPFLSGPNMAVRRTAWRDIDDSLCRDRMIHEDIDLAIHLAKKHLKLVYDSKLRASVSTRRYNSNWAEFRKYMSAFDYTYRAHNLHGFRIHSASTAYWLGYIIVHPLRRPLVALSRLFNPSIPTDTIPRRNPN